MVQDQGDLAVERRRRLVVVVLERGRADAEPDEDDLATGRPAGAGRIRVVRGAKRHIRGGYSGYFQPVVVAEARRYEVEGLEVRAVCPDA